MVSVTTLHGIRGALIDVDGTLLVGDEAVPGAASALEALRARGLALRLTTNTTRRSRRGVAAALRAVGFAVEDREVLAPSILARQRILGSRRPTALLLVSPDARADFEDVAQETDVPGFVVVGDIGEGFTFEVLNTAFRALRAGAELLALHRNPFWTSASGVVLDAGAFVASLEYATGVRAVCVGKPEAVFFDLALAELGLPASSVVVVGDDPVNDAAAGTAAGCRTVLVLTGKESNDVGVADCVLASVADLPRALAAAE